MVRSASSGSTSCWPNTGAHSSMLSGSACCEVLGRVPQHAAAVRRVVEPRHRLGAVAVARVPVAIARSPADVRLARRSRVGAGERRRIGGCAGHTVTLVGRRAPGDGTLPLSGSLSRRVGGWPATPRGRGERRVAGAGAARRVRRHHRSLTLTELARRADLPTPTTHRLVAELVAWGALARRPPGEYVVGRRMWDLGLLAPVQTGLREVASPFLHDIYAATLATVHLACATAPRCSTSTGCPGTRPCRWSADRLPAAAASDRRRQGAARLCAGEGAASRCWRT